MKKLFLTLCILFLSTSLCWGAIDFSSDLDDYLTLDSTITIGSSAAWSLYFKVKLPGIASQWDGKMFCGKHTATTDYLQINDLNTMDMKINNTIRRPDWTDTAFANNAEVILIITCNASGSINFYVDGVISNDSPITDTDPFDITVINNGISSANFSMADTMRECAVFTKELSTQDRALLDSSETRYIPLQIGSCSLYLTLDDRPDGETGISGTVYKDKSGNGNDGTGVDATANSINVAETLLSYP